MAIRPTLQIGDPTLNAKNHKIKDFNDLKLKSIIQDLTDSMYDAGLIGISAPQIGENYQVFVTEPRETKSRPKDQADELRIYINPVIVNKSKEKIIIYEGCGSIANGKLFGPVERPKIITVEAFDEKGKKFRFTADGILGRVIQHEYDHMNGIQFLEKISDYKKVIAFEFYSKRVKNDPKHIKASKITIKKLEKVK